jgi:hypothetical protein
VVEMVHFNAYRAQRMLTVCKILEASLGRKTYQSLFMEPQVMYHHAHASASFSSMPRASQTSTELRIIIQMGTFHNRTCKIKVETLHIGKGAGVWICRLSKHHWN